MVVVLDMRQKVDGDVYGGGCADRYAGSFHDVLAYTFFSDSVERNSRKMRNGTLRG